MNPPINEMPQMVKRSPINDCSQSTGKGDWRIPKSMSLINLMPYAAIAPGIKRIIKAIRRFIWSRSLPQKFLLIKMIGNFKYLSSHSIQFLYDGNNRIM